MIETAYEGEHQATPDRIRRQAWWSMLCGACGQFFGNNPIWYFDGPGFTQFRSAPTWQEALDSQGARDMTRLARFFHGHPWWGLIPDPEDGIVSAGREATKVTAALLPDHRLIVLYVPAAPEHARELELNLSRCPSPVTASWHNPARDEGPRAGGVIQNASHQRTRVPAENGGGSNDWVLVLEAVSKPQGSN